MISNKFKAKFSKIYRDVAKMVTYDKSHIVNIKTLNDDEVKRELTLHAAKSKNVIKPH